LIVMPPFLTDRDKPAPCSGSAVHTGDKPADIRAARAICAPCPHTDDCAAWAIDTGQKNGVWGGYTGAERTDPRTVQALRRRQAANRRASPGTQSGPPTTPSTPSRS
jgi:WhiB family redox-sensing transcriptional regulator